MSWERVATEWLAEAPELESVDLVAARRYREVMAALCPTLGISSVGLVFARSLRLSSRRFPFLERVLTLEGTDAMAERLHLTLALQDREAALEASVALFSTFMGLLATFLGPPLVTRLLSDIGPSASGQGVAEELTS